MKKIMMVLFSGVFLTSLITSYATAQKATNASYPSPAIANTNGSAKIKKNAAANAVDPVDKTALKVMKANIRAAKANLKVTNNFNRNFPNVSDLNWNSEAKAIVATFQMNEKSGRVVYDKKGNWLYTILTYNADQMPGHIRNLVEDSYRGFTISLVQEISQGDINLYKVHLEDSTRIKQILVFNDEITVYEEFTKNR